MRKLVILEESHPEMYAWLQKQAKEPGSKLKLPDGRGLSMPGKDMAKLTFKELREQTDKQENGDHIVDKNIILQLRVVPFGRSVAVQVLHYGTHICEDERFRKSIDSALVFVAQNGFRFLVASRGFAAGDGILCLAPWDIGGVDLVNLSCGQSLRSWLKELSEALVSFGRYLAPVVAGTVEQHTTTWHYFLHTDQVPRGRKLLLRNGNGVIVPAIVDGAWAIVLGKRRQPLAKFTHYAFEPASFTQAKQVELHKDGEIWTLRRV